MELNPATGSARTTALGRDLATGQRLQHVVPPHTWFGAAPAAGTEWALVGCTVAPGGRAAAAPLARVGRRGLRSRRVCSCKRVLQPALPCVMHVCCSAGFLFDTFEMGRREQLLADFPAAAAWIERLMA